MPSLFSPYSHVYPTICKVFKLFCNANIKKGVLPFPSTKTFRRYFRKHSGIPCNISHSLKHVIFPSTWGSLLRRMTAEAKTWPCWIHRQIHSSIHFNCAPFLPPSAGAGKLSPSHCIFQLRCYASRIVSKQPGLSGYAYKLSLSGCAYTSSFLCADTCSCIWKINTHPHRRTHILPSHTAEGKIIKVNT